MTNLQSISYDHSSKLLVVNSKIRHQVNILQRNLKLFLVIWTLPLKVRKRRIIISWINRNLISILNLRSLNSDPPVSTGMINNGSTPIKEIAIEPKTENTHGVYSNSNWNIFILLKVNFSMISAKTCCNDSSSIGDIFLTDFELNHKVKHVDAITIALILDLFTW